MTKMPGFDVEFDKVLSMDSPTFIEDFKRALGISEEDVVEFVTPQFDRTDGITPANPQDVWNHINNCSPETLKELGCLAWDEPDKNGYQLWLFPTEWYDKIPKGFLVTDINGESESFEPGITDNDKRFGVLAYGVNILANT